MHTGDLAAVAADAHGAHGPASLTAGVTLITNIPARVKEDRRRNLQQGEMRGAKDLFLNPGTGAAHEDCDVGHEGVKTANGARVLAGAASKPADECDSFSLELQVRAHEEG